MTARLFSHQLSLSSVMLVLLRWFLHLSVSSLLLHSGTTELKAQSLSVSLQHGFSVSSLSFAVGIRVHRSFLILQTTLYSDLSRIWQQKLSSSLISVMWHSMRLTLPLSYLHSSLLTSSIQ